MKIKEEFLMPRNPLDNRDYIDSVFKVLERIEKDNTLGINFKLVIALCSVDLRNLITIHKKAKETDKMVLLYGMSEDVRKIFSTTHLDRLLVIKD